MAEYTIDKFTYGSNTYKLKDKISGYTTNTGTVTKVSTGVGLTGGDITTTGTIKTKLNSETSLGTIGTTDKLYAVGVDANGKLCVNVPWSDTNTEVSTLTLAAGSTAGTSLTSGGKFTLTAGSKTVSFTMPTIPSITLNGSSTTSPSFYAPTGAGTSGYYLKSNGSGAPSWTSFPTIPSITLNGSSTTSPSFYAPTSAGTSGYFLESNGSGAPSWTNIADYIIAKGRTRVDSSSPYWYYEKWNSGKIEAWSESISSGTLTMAASGNLYRGAGVSVKIPSGIFSSAPTSAYVTGNYNNAAFVNAICALTSSTELTCQIWKATNATTAVNMKIHAVYYPSSY